MKLTKKKALLIAIELWEWIVDNPGEEKDTWPGWAGYGTMLFACPLCEYQDQEGGVGHKVCPECPYFIKFGRCCRAGRIRDTRAFEKWLRTVMKLHEDGSHAAAVEFLAQLKELK